MAYLRRRLYRRLRRGYRPSRRVRLSYRSRRSIRKDLQKLGFPNKVKFIGMTQKRSFLLRSNMVSVQIVAGSGTTEHTLGPNENISLYTLDPREAANWDINIGEGLKSRYQLFTVKKIYVRVTPCANSFPSDTSSLSQLRMSYHMYYIPGNDAVYANALSEQSSYKDEYQFASNKSITFVIKRPKPFFPTDVMVGSARSEISISALDPVTKTESRDNYRDYDDEDEEVSAFSSRDFNYGTIVFAGPTGTKFNVQISYKVTVKN